MTSSKLPPFDADKMLAMSVGKNPTMTTQPPRCLGQVRLQFFVQEHYETGTPDARRRAATLRNAGFTVTVSPLGPQVTPVGTINITMLTAHGDLDTLPPVTISKL
jgi:hypothetical protein